MEIFLRTYRACRDEFRRLVAAQPERVTHSGALSLPNSGGDSRALAPALAHPDAHSEALSDLPADLSIDYALLSRRREPKRLAIISSGLHGVEGYAGSALQRSLLADGLGELVDQGLSVLLLHGINPFGFANRRRTTASNVDLNRNFDSTGGLYQTQNAGYAHLSELLAPARRVEARDLRTELFGEALERLARTLPEAEFGADTKAESTLQQAIAGGQYSFSRGLYYGGTVPEPHQALLRPLLQKMMAKTERTVIADIHTGYGKRGQLHFFPDASARSQEAEIEKLFAGYHIDWGDSPGFYSVTGEFVAWVATLCPPDCSFVPMVFEFGTLDSHTHAGALRSVHSLSLENQLYFFGSANQSIRREIESRFDELFFPEGTEWQDSVLGQGRAALQRVLARLL